MDEQMQWEKILRRAIAAEASDLHVSAHQRVQMRCDGVLCAAEMTPTADFMHVLTASMLSEGQQAVLAAQHDVDFSWQYEGRRFRGNVYRVRDVPALAFRLLPARIRTPGEIGMPASLRAKDWHSSAGRPARARRRRLRRCSRRSIKRGRRIL